MGKREGVDIYAELSGFMRWMDGGEGNFEKLMKEVNEEEDKKRKKQMIVVK